METTETLLYYYNAYLRILLVCIFQQKYFNTFHHGSTFQLQPIRKKYITLMKTLENTG